MDLLNIQYADSHIRLSQSAEKGFVALFVDDQQVSEPYPLKPNNTFEFSLPAIGAVLLSFDLDLIAQKVKIQIRRGEQVLYSDEKAFSTPQSPNVPPREDSGAVQATRSTSFDNPEQLNTTKRAKKGFNGHIWAWAGIAFKLFKSVKVIQVALIGMSLGAWGIIYSWEFAAAIIGILIFHEYGHLRAMKKCGIPTKGIYLIPFVGGVAVGDSPKTHWQEVYIAMMGPFFGLAMTLLFGIGYYFTENHFMGLVASISALVNLFNLLPVLPLDGGRVFKALALSGQKKAGLVTVGLLTIAGLAFAIKLGLMLLIFFLILGVLDLMASWREFKNNPGMSMNAYGITFSLVWYLITAGGLIGIILLMAHTGLPGTELALMVLQD
ncbi:Zn-dependent protease [Oleiphilus messinensis]|uniref:Zn-dependent protease n=1 Tax=Oleiphilus messinensis TaxID=141451 RepID=A0A1Y0I6S3_9GAMM|nr:site-2 protease family protein [Oleiphilus messinensis]ARU55124.1 Zn-dependent protease [Oleiphilus messinensis]